MRKYSDHVAFPIRMPKDAPTPAEGEEAPVDAAPEWETANDASALWTKAKSDISDEDYQNFYKALGHDFNDAAAWTHNRVEGSQSFTTLLYLPSQPPFDLMMGGRDERKGLKLYIKRVFVMDAAEELLPNYLRFVRGVVDADDLPLNVSREILQHNRQLERIRGACVKRVLDLIEKLSRDEPEKFAAFLKAFGNTLKEGIVEDATNRERIAKILRFASTKGDGAAQTVSLDDYVGRMPVGQDTIWYITADGYKAAAGSPHATVLLTGVAGTVAGAMSMAAGEYVSVRSQLDTEQADLATERNDNAALKIFEDLGIELRNPVPGRGGGAVRDPDCGIFGTHASGREELGKPRHPGFKLVPPFRNCRYPFALTLDGTDERVRKQGVSIRGVILHRAGGEPGFLRHLPHAHRIEAARRDDADGRVGDGRGRF